MDKRTQNQGTAPKGIRSGETGGVLECWSIGALGGGASPARADAPTERRGYNGGRLGWGQPTLQRRTVRSVASARGRE
jgi:hypothetical protein